MLLTIDRESCEKGLGDVEGKAMGIPEDLTMNASKDRLTLTGVG